MKTVNRSGFSLIELSIVLVILGLIVGGILAGLSLIRAAELRSVSVDFQSHKAAIQAFDNKYSALPGDMPNATRFWAAADGGDGLGADCHDVDVSASNATCNGNGNGLLNMNDGSLTPNGAEWYHAWVHLRNAGLIQGDFSGRRVSDPRGALPGVNVPKSELSDAGYVLMGHNPGSGGTFNWYPGHYRLLLMVGRGSSVGTQAPVLTSAEAWAIDTKMDDGKPGLGGVQVLHDNANCVTDTDKAAQYTAEYSLLEDIACTLLLVMDYAAE